jgi:hypothetical protein
MSTHLTRPDPQNVAETARFVSMLYPIGSIDDTRALIEAYRASGAWATNLERINAAVAALDPLKNDPSRAAQRLRRRLLDLLQAGIAPRYPFMASQITINVNHEAPRPSHGALLVRAVAAVVTAVAALLGAMKGIGVL